MVLSVLAEEEHYRQLHILLDAIDTAFAAKTQVVWQLFIDLRVALSIKCLFREQERIKT